VQWLMDTYGESLGKKVYLVGFPTNVYPRTANTIIKEQNESSWW